MRRLVAAAIAVLLAANVVTAAVMTSTAGAASDPSPFVQARPFSLPPVITGRPTVRFTSTPGRPTILTFFASWCEPCISELPLIEKVSQRHDLAVVGVDELDQRPDGPDLVRSARVMFPAGFDHDGAVGQKYDIDGLPITVFIAADGHIVAYHRGQLESHQLDDLVNRLLRSNQ